MDGQDEKEKAPLFPAKYAHLEPVVLEAQAQLKDADMQIDHASGKGPHPAPAPSWAKGANPNFAREEAIGKLNLWRGQIHTQTLSKVREAVKDADPKLAKKILDKTEYLLNTRNPYLDLSSKQKEAQRGITKKNSLSMDYMSSLHFEHQTFALEKGSNKAKEIAAPREIKKENGERLSLADTYLKPLNYTIQTNRSDTDQEKAQPSKRKDRGMDMDKD